MTLGGVTKFVKGSWKPDYPLGTYGVDASTKTAWAVINYNGDFAVATGIGPVPGDLNGDGAVMCTDLAIVKASFGKRTGQAGFDARADVNTDGVVDVRDLSFVARQIPSGTKCP